MQVLLAILVGITILACGLLWSPWPLLIGGVIIGGIIYFPKINTALFAKIKLAWAWIIPILIIVIVIWKNNYDIVKIIPEEHKFWNKTTTHSPPPKQQWVCVEDGNRRKVFSDEINERTIYFVLQNSRGENFSFVLKKTSPNSNTYKGYWGLEGGNERGKIELSRISPQIYCGEASDKINSSKYEIKLYLE